MLSISATSVLYCSTWLEVGGCHWWPLLLSHLDWSSSTCGLLTRLWHKNGKSHHGTRRPDWAKACLLTVSQDVTTNDPKLPPTAEPKWLSMMIYDGVCRTIEETEANSTVSNETIDRLTSGAQLFHGQARCCAVKGRLSLESLRPAWHTSMSWNVIALPYWYLLYLGIISCLYSNDFNSLCSTMSDHFPSLHVSYLLCHCLGVLLASLKHIIQVGGPWSKCPNPPKKHIFREFFRSLKWRCCTIEGYVWWGSSLT